MADTGKSTQVKVKKAGMTHIKMKKGKIKEEKSNKTTPS